MAMGQNPNRTPSKHPNPTTKIGSNMGGEFTYPKMGSRNGFDNQKSQGPRGESLLSKASVRLRLVALFARGWTVYPWEEVSQHWLSPKKPDEPERTRANPMFRPSCPAVSASLFSFFFLFSGGRESQPTKKDAVFVPMATGHLAFESKIPAALALSLA